jgi:hypothetical protein
MSLDYTTTALVESLKRRIIVPTAQSLFTQDQFIAIMNDEMHSTLIPYIHAAREEYFVTNYDVTVGSSQDVYPMPSRAIGGMLRDVVLVDTSDNEVEVPRLEPEYIKSSSVMSSARLNGYYLKDSNVVLFPKPGIISTYTTLRLKYERRPNNLVSVSKASYITNINTGTNEVTIASTPTNWTSATIFDFISNNPIFSSIADSKSVTSLVGNILTFATLPTGIALGHWVSEQYTTPVAQLPYEAHHVLAQLGATKCLEALKDKVGLEDAKAKAKEMLSDFVRIINPRVGGAAKKIVNRGGIFEYGRQTGNSNRI